MSYESTTVRKVSSNFLSCLFSVTGRANLYEALVMDRAACCKLQDLRAFVSRQITVSFMPCQLGEPNCQFHGSTHNACIVNLFREVWWNECHTRFPHIVSALLFDTPGLRHGAGTFWPQTLSAFALLQLSELLVFGDHSCNPQNEFLWTFGAAPASESDKRCLPTVCKVAQQVPRDAHFLRRTCEFFCVHPCCFNLCWLEPLELIRFSTGTR